MDADIATTLRLRLDPPPALGRIRTGLPTWQARRDDDRNTDQTEVRRRHLNGAGVRIVRLTGPGNDPGSGVQANPKF